MSPISNVFNSQYCNNNNAIITIIICVQLIIIQKSIYKIMNKKHKVNGFIMPAHVLRITNTLPKRRQLRIQTNDPRTQIPPSLFARSWQLTIKLFSGRGSPNYISGCDFPAFPSWFSTTFPKIVVEVMTSGQPQVKKLWLGSSKGMLPAKQLAPKIFMAVNHCGCQLARGLGLAAPANLKKEGLTHHLRACNHSLQYDGRLD